MKEADIDHQIITLLEYVKSSAIQNGLSGPEELAEQAGFHRNQVSRWLNHNTSPTLFSFLRLCAAGKVRIKLEGEGMEEELLLSFDQD